MPVRQQNRCTAHMIGDCGSVALSRMYSSASVSWKILFQQLYAGEKFGRIFIYIYRVGWNSWNHWNLSRRWLYSSSPKEHRWFAYYEDNHDCVKLWGNSGYADRISRATLVVSIMWEIKVVHLLGTFIVSPISWELMVVRCLNGCLSMLFRGFQLPMVVLIFKYPSMLRRPVFMLYTYT